MKGEKLNPFIAVATVLAAVGAYLLYRKYAQGALQFAGVGDLGGGGGGGGVTDSTRGPSGVAMQWNEAIANAAKQAGIDPILLKSIVATETGFNPDAINPEKDFILNGVSYKQYDRAGQAALVAWIKAGNDPASIGLNPSCGIAQVRVSNAKKFVSALEALDLFDGATCLLAAALLIADDGTTFETVDMYNVGNGSLWARGVRNTGYRAKAQKFYQQFLADF